VFAGQKSNGYEDHLLKNKEPKGGGYNGHGLKVRKKELIFVPEKNYKSEKENKEEDTTNPGRKGVERLGGEKVAEKGSYLTGLGRILTTSSIGGKEVNLKENRTVRANR